MCCWPISAFVLIYDMPLTRRRMYVGTINIIYVHFIYLLFIMSYLPRSIPSVRSTVLPGAQENIGCLNFIRGLPRYCNIVIEVSIGYVQTAHLWNSDIFEKSVVIAVGPNVRAQVYRIIRHHSVSRCSVSRTQTCRWRLFCLLCRSRRFAKLWITTQDIVFPVKVGFSFAWRQWFSAGFPPNVNATCRR